MKKDKDRKPGTGEESYKEDDPKDPDFPSGKLTRIPDFLPPPDQLVFPDEGMLKVTIVLKKTSVEFFKEKARQHHTKYQRMIREVLDRYARQYAS